MKVLLLAFLGFTSANALAANVFSCTLTGPKGEVTVDLDVDLVENSKESEDSPYSLLLESYNEGGVISAKASVEVDADLKKEIKFKPFVLEQSKVAVIYDEFLKNDMSVSMTCLIYGEKQASLKASPIEVAARLFGPVECYAAQFCEGPMIGTTGTPDMCKVAGGKSFAPVGTEWTCRNL